MELIERREIIKNGVMEASKKLINEDYLPHRHDFFEIEYIISGSGKYAVNGREYDIVPNRIFFMTPADFHAVYPHNVELINIMFPSRLVENEALFSLTLNGEGDGALPLGEDAVLLRLLALEIVSAVERGEYTYGSDFLTCFVRKTAELVHQRAEEPILYIKKAILYILQGFTERLTLEDTAKHLGLSKNYLSELFAKEMSMGFKEYVDKLRFDYVARLLVYSDMSITEAYEKSGFSDYANFSRRFKQKYKMSPTQYRRMQSGRQT